MWRKSLRRTALVLCAAFMLMVVASVGISLVHAGHHCADGHCPICVAYTGSQLVMQALGIVAVAHAMTRILRLAPPVQAAPALPVMVIASPVSLNIRLND